MPKITPLQWRLLTHAAERENGSLFPLPDAIPHPPTVRRSIAALLGRGWVRSQPTTDESTMARLEGNVRYGVFVTPAGHVAIGIAPYVPQICFPAHRASKAATLIALLLCDHGATLAELVEVAGWLPPSTRAALAGLRDRGDPPAGGDVPAGLPSYRIVTI